MSIKGRPSHWFEAAVRRGDLTAALAETHELPRPLPLAYGLALVVLLADAADARHGRWAARWAGRFAIERDSVDLAVLADVVALLAASHTDGASARHNLVTLAGRHGVADVAALIAGIPPPPKLL